MTTWINTSGRASNGARRLREALPARKFRLVQGINGLVAKLPSVGQTIINWGGVGWDNEYHRVLNKPAALAVASNKLAAFHALSPHCRMPVWTTHWDVASEWLSHGHIVVARQLLTSHSGRGIVICEDYPLVNAPLYTSYVKKAAEYRVHIVNGVIIDVQRKIRDNTVDAGQINWKVRTHETGFFYVRGNVELPGDARVQSLSAFAASGLDFGAVDVIWNEQQQLAYVLEINTAPGIEGQTVGNYAESFRQLIEEG